MVVGKEVVRLELEAILGVAHFEGDAGRLRDTCGDDVHSAFEFFLSKHLVVPNASYEPAALKRDQDPEAAPSRETVARVRVHDLSDHGGSFPFGKVENVLIRSDILVGSREQKEQICSFLHTDLAK